MGDFKRLLVWHRARDLSLEVYRASALFPHAEQFGLTLQIRRCAMSITANIAESCGRYHVGDQRRFLCIAQGSAHELESHLILAHDLAFLATQDRDRLNMIVVEVQRMLAGLIRRKQRDTMSVLRN